MYKENDTETDSYYSLDNNLTKNRRLKKIFSINVIITCLTTYKICVIKYQNN